ncbi:MAG: hypothetical protein J6C97_00730 [Clostridia bacterium]|nr:hypothetical protein [Clostridia bacterium]
MKRFFTKNLNVILCVIMFVSLIVTSVVGFNLTKGKNGVDATDYSVNGGRLTYNFDTAGEMQNFSLYGEFGSLPYHQAGKVYFRAVEEQKLILNGYTFTDVEIIAKVQTINDGGKFDGGLYIQASNAGNGMDKINAYNINIENEVGASTYTVKLHLFAQAWSGIKAEKSGITLKGAEVTLKAVVKSGILYVFADDMQNPIFNYSIGTDAGQIGFRSFYSPHMLDSLTITSPSITLDKAQLESLKTSALNMVNSGAYTDVSVSKLNSAISLANNATTATLVQEATIRLNKAIDNALIKRTFVELTELISEAEQITDGSKYTYNSFSTFTTALSYAKGLTSSSAEHDIALWYSELQLAKDRLVILAGV